MVGIQNIIDHIYDMLKPGITPTLIIFARYSIILVLIFSIIMTYVDYNIHYLILSFLSTGLFLSFEYSMLKLKKYPNLIRNNKIKYKFE